MLKNVDYHIIDRCNLNCAGCNDFSPLVSPDDKGKSIEQITADFMLLSKIKNEFYILNIMGGEPTLHPELSKILRIARQIFPDNKIRLLTNGTNYDKFYRWKDAIVENKIDVVVSVYPYCPDYQERYDKLASILRPEVEIDEYWTAAVTDGFNRATFSNQYGVANEEDIQTCTRRFACPQLKNGKIYLCPFAAQFDKLKTYFGDKITFDYDGKEYLDLNGDVTPKDFYDFIYGARPLMCNHCVGAHNKWLGPKHQWETTKKSLDEWVSE